MTEKLLQFIWQLQYFNSSNLITSAGEKIQILKPGQLNNEQGPDFRDAKICIGTTTWAGSIELHVRASDWNRHRHQNDINYQNVILHVVWENDEVVNTIPVLELRSRISKLLLDKYGELMQASSFISCEKMVHTVPEITWKTWKERLLVERMIRKAQWVMELLAGNEFHWEETFWWLLARSFGMKTNADAFEAIARSLPLGLLAKHKMQLQQLEALLLGQAGLLDKKLNDPYAQLLQREYRFLKKKYKLKPVSIPVHLLRMRPSNFPSLRLAQLAMLIHHSVHLFSRIKEAGSISEVRKWFDLTANDYWHYHYRLDISSPFKKKNIGDAMSDNIMINTIGPVLFAYGYYYDDPLYKQKALHWLEQIKPESNLISRGFEKLGLENRSAYESQSLIELKNEYCDRKRCLECSIGNAILKNKE